MSTKNNHSKNRFHHVGIVVRDISKAISKYAGALGIEESKIAVEVMSYVSGKGEAEEFKYAFLPLAISENNFIELVEPITPGPTARYLEKHGEGLFHLAFESSHIIETIEEFEAAGIHQAGATPTEEILSVFFHPKQSHGVLIQVLKKGIFNETGKISNDVLEQG